MIPPGIIEKMAGNALGVEQASALKAKALSLQVDPNTVLIAKTNGISMTEVAHQMGFYEGLSMEPGGGGDVRVRTDQMVFEHGLDPAVARSHVVQKLAGEVNVP